MKRRNAWVAAGVAVATLAPVPGSVTTAGWAAAADRAGADSTQAIELPEVRIEAPRWTEDTALPLATTVIDRAAIEGSGARHLGEILRPVVGVRVATTGGLGSFTPISIRGSSNDQVLVLLDGRRLNAAQGGGVDLSDIPLDNIERIEVVRGGASAIHGADAIGGTVNLITRSTPTGSEAGARLEYGSYDTKLATLHLADGRYGAAWRVDARRCLSDGSLRVAEDVGSPVGSPAVASAAGTDSDGGRDDLDMFWGSGRVTWHPEWVPRLDLSGTHEQSDKGVPGSTEFASPAARQGDEFSSAALDLDGLLAGTSAASGGRVFAQRRIRSYVDPSNPLGAVDDHHRNDSWGVSLDQDRDLGRAGRLHAGAEWRREELTSSTDGHHLRSSAALWLRDAIPLDADGRLELTPALRWDGVEDFAWRLSPMLMGRWEASESVRLRASAGAAFRPPAFDDLFQPPRASAAGNPDLKPEQSWNGDLGVTLTTGRWTLGATGFLNRIQDLIQWQPGAAGIWRPHNVDGARILGAEIEASGVARIPVVDQVVNLSGNYTVLDPRETGNASNTAGKVLVYRPQHRVNAGARLPFGAFEFDTQWAYTGFVYTTRANTKSLPAYLVGDAGLKWHARPGLDVEWRVQNLTDEHYQDFRDYPAPGREWRLALVGRTGS
jgi:outer membrane cobalamin receptor